MKQENPDAFLLAHLEQGDPDAFNALYNKYWQLAYATAFKRLKDTQQVKDIIQEVFTRIWINRKTHIENFPAYLHIAIRNAVIKSSIKQKRATAFVEQWNKNSFEFSRADDEIQWKEFSKAYNEVIKRLPSKRQAIYRMRFHDDMNTKKIAEDLGLTRKTVQNQLLKAVEQLRSNLKNFFTFVILYLLLLL